MEVLILGFPLKIYSTRVNIYLIYELWYEVKWKTNKIHKNPQISDSSILSKKGFLFEIDGIRTCISEKVLSKYYIHNYTQSLNYINHVIIFSKNMLVT